MSGQAGVEDNDAVPPGGRRNHKRVSECVIEDSERGSKRGLRAGTQRMNCAHTNNQLFVYNKSIPWYFN